MHGCSGYAFKLVNEDKNWVYTQILSRALTFLLKKTRLTYPPALAEGSLRGHYIRKLSELGCQERFINNVSHKISLCKDKEILKQQTAIF